MSKGILNGIKVLDLTRVVAGPYCGMLLGDMGATVYKVERPKGGDDGRAYGPYVNGESVYYINFNRSKYGCTLNLKSNEGKEIFKEMVKHVDVVIENYRPGTMDKLGLGYDVLKEVNPSIIYGSVSGFGHSGRYRDRAGYDIIGQAMGGLMSTTGWPDGEETRTGTPIADVLAGLSMTIGVLASIINRNDTGEGQKVDIALVDSVVSAMANLNLIYLGSGIIPGRIGNRYESTYPYDSFKASDGNVIIGAGNTKLYQLLCDVMQRPELKNDKRFKTANDRVKNHIEMKNVVEQWSIKHTVKDIASMLTDAGVPSSPINSVDKVVEDEHISVDREMFPTIEHPVYGKMKVTNNQIKFNVRKSGPTKPAPLLGEDNEMIFYELAGISKEEVAKLKEKGVI
ncbi:MAG: CaiB/BaiF CoA transferase family protein [Lentihominibacter sp.]